MGCPFRELKKARSTNGPLVVNHSTTVKEARRFAVAPWLIEQGIQCSTLFLGEVWHITVTFLWNILLWTLLWKVMSVKGLSA